MNANGPSYSQTSSSVLTHSHHKSQGKEGRDFFSSGYNFHETIKVDTLLSITKNKKIEKISQVSLSNLA
jgi:hypothetical protein